MSTRIAYHLRQCLDAREGDVIQLAVNVIGAVVALEGFQACEVFLVGARFIANFRQQWESFAEVWLFHDIGTRRPHPYACTGEHRPVKQLTWVLLARGRDIRMSHHIPRADSMALQDIEAEVFDSLSICTSGKSR